MLNPRWTEAGVGYAVGNGQNFYVMVSRPTMPRHRGRAAGRRRPFIVAPLNWLNPTRTARLSTVLEATLWAIAACYEVSLADLYLFNGLNEESVINPGDKLTHSAGRRPPPPHPPAYRRPRGRIAMVIAAYYKTDLATLLWLNGLPEDAQSSTPATKSRCGWCLAKPTAPPTPQLDPLSSKAATQPGASLFLTA